MTRKRPVKLYSFGSFLTKCRLAAGISSLNTVVIKFNDLKLKGVENTSISQISYDEHGQTFDIPPDRLRAYAELYKVPYEEIVEKLVEEKYGVVKKTTIEDFRALVPQKQAELHEILQKILAKRKIRTVRKYLIFIAHGLGLRGFSKWGGKKIEEEEETATG